MLNPIDQVTNQPIFPDGQKIALVSPHLPSSWTDNNIHEHKHAPKHKLLGAQVKRG